MRITLATSGGQAAAILRRLPPRVLDTDSLPPGPAGEARRLVAAASAEGGAGGGGAPGVGRARDAMSYRITVDDEARSITLTGSDAAMTPAFAALLSWLERHLAT